MNPDRFKVDGVLILYYGSGSAEPDSKPQFPADIHQYTEHGRLEGYNGNLDLKRIISDKSLSYFTDGKVTVMIVRHPSATSTALCRKSLTQSLARVRSPRLR